jgi:hypothetical protein
LSVSTRSHKAPAPMADNYGQAIPHEQHNSGGDDQARGGNWVHRLNFQNSMFKSRSGRPSRRTAGTRSAARRSPGSLTIDGLGCGRQHAYPLARCRACVPETTVVSPVSMQCRRCEVRNIDMYELDAGGCRIDDHSPVTVEPGRMSGGRSASPTRTLNVSVTGSASEATSRTRPTALTVVTVMIFRWGWQSGHLEARRSLSELGPVRHVGRCAGNSQRPDSRLGRSVRFLASSWNSPARSAAPVPCCRQARS